MVAGDLSGHFLFGSNERIAWSDLVGGSVLNGRRKELRGRSVLLTSKDQLRTATVLVELDGVARRIVLCPPDLNVEYFPYIKDAAETDAVVSDDGLSSACTTVDADAFYCCGGPINSGIDDRTSLYQTEWILLTSGTTGVPKLVVHTLASLIDAIHLPAEPRLSLIWSTFYDIRRYGGLQIFLRAALTGTSLVLSGETESIGDFLVRIGSHGTTHISGTPSHWRTALMSTSANALDPKNVRLSGEVADQSILNHVKDVYPLAGITHVFASTEAGIAFEVNDGVAGFPADILDSTPGIDMKVEDGSLRIRSARTAERYLGHSAPALKDEDGFVDTGDILELREGRYHFAGRRDGVINVGGRKVHPEEVEAVINRHPEVQMSLVRRKRNPVTGAVVVADVVLKRALPTYSCDVVHLQESILQLCRGTLSAYKVPVTIRFVPSLAVSGSGKMVRADA